VLSVRAYELIFVDFGWDGANHNGSLIWGACDSFSKMLNVFIFRGSEPEYSSYTEDVLVLTIRLCDLK
jgi:hypothetical protein